MAPPDGGAKADERVKQIPFAAGPCDFPRSVRLGVGTAVCDFFFFKARRRGRALGSSMQRVQGGNVISRCSPWAVLEVPTGR